MQSQCPGRYSRQVSKVAVEIAIVFRQKRLCEACSGSLQKRENHRSSCRKKEKRHSSHFRYLRSCPTSHLIHDHTQKTESFCQTFLQGGPSAISSFVADRPGLTFSRIMINLGQLRTMTVATTQQLGRSTPCPSGALYCTMLRRDKSNRGSPADDFDATQA